MIIRKATLEDAEFIAPLLLLPMEEIIYKFIGKKDLYMAQQFLLHFLLKKNNQYSYQNCWVAIEDEAIVAAAIIYDGAELTALRQPVLEYIKSRYNTDITIEDETEAGEFYLDSIGVQPSKQGKGIGRKLLQFLIHEYVNKGNKTLGLLVDVENETARNLYLKLGFKKGGDKMLLGNKLEHLQINKKNF